MIGRVHGTSVRRLGALLVLAVVVVACTPHVPGAPPAAASARAAAERSQALEPAGIRAPSAGTPANAPADPPIGETTVWSLATVVGADDDQQRIIERLTAEVYERSQGRLVVRHYDRSALYPLFDLASAVTDGRADMALLPTTALSDTRPHLALAELPYLTSDTGNVRRLAEALRPAFERDLASLGLVYLLTVPRPAQHLFTTGEPVTTLARWSGQRLRTASLEAADLVRVLGGTPVTIAPDELRLGLERGLVQGALASGQLVQATGADQLVRYASLWRWNAGSADLLVVNERAWTALPPALRTVVADVAADERLTAQIWALHGTADARSLEALLARGVRIAPVRPSEIELARARARDRSWPTWRERAGAAGEDLLRLVEHMRP